LDPQSVPADIFFMKQMAMNACGTIGLFHIILNAAKEYPTILTPDSYLSKFSYDSSSKNPAEIGKMFKENKEILQ
jgi:ubiquitin carboxyl-terminal hydrolase L3